VKLRYKPLTLVFCMGLLSFIVIGGREAMTGIGTVLAGGVVSYFAASAAGDYCRSKYYRRELDDRYDQQTREGVSP
jgi:hypothetical protein